jgi:malic enzyme
LWALVAYTEWALEACTVALVGTGSAGLAVVCQIAAVVLRAARPTAVYILQAPSKERLGIPQCNSAQWQFGSLASSSAANRSGILLFYLID